MLLRWLKRAALGLLALTALAVLLAAVTPQGRTGVRTALFLPQVLPTFPVKPQEWFTGKPTREEVVYPLAVGSGVADLYRPASDGRHPAVLLFLGVNPAGRDDSRVVALAVGLARAGVVVMIPWSDTMTQKRVSAGEIDNLVHAFQHLVSLDVVDPEKAGMGGFCVGASFSTVAAQDPRVRDQVRFVNFFGGYYDARDLVASVVSSTRFGDGTEESWSPDKLSVEVVYTHLVEGVSDLAERELLYRVFVLRDAVLDDAVAAGSSSEARVVFELLSGVDLARANELIDALPQRALDALDAISPKTRIDQLNARVLIMHDREDDLVSSEESRRLAAALADRGDVYHTEFSLFKHLDPTRAVSPPVYVKELLKLYLHMYHVLKELS